MEPWEGLGAQAAQGHRVVGVVVWQGKTEDNQRLG